MQTEKDPSKTTWIGIDVAKNSFVAGIYIPGNPDEKHRKISDIPVAEFERTRDGVKALYEWTYYHRNKNNAEAGNMRAVMEATGRYSLELYDWLMDEMPLSEPAIEDGKVISDYIKSLKLRNKTDQLDAAAIAKYGAERRPTPHLELSEEYKCLRELTRQRSAIKAQLVAAKARLGEVCNFSKIIKIQKDLIKSFEKAIKSLEKEITKCINESADLREDVKFACSVPGVAEITAATILAECGPLDKYTSRQLGAYSGLAPQQRNSGTSVRGCRINKRGPARLRQILYMSSITTSSKAANFKALHSRITQQGKKPLQARCAVMRKLLILVRAVVVNKTFYDKNFVKNA
jgi:transposase